jgi:hypothetical protein
MMAVMLRLALAALLALFTWPPPQAADSTLRFEIAFAPSARAEPVTGRVYVAISRENNTERPPIREVGETGAPLFSRNVDALRPGATATIDQSDPGHPIASLRDLPAGEYWVQAFVNVYTRFARSDGKTVWLHMDQWEGQQWNRSPGNLYSTPVKMRVDPKRGETIKLVCDRVVPAIALPADTENVKHIRFESRILSRWWGHPIFLGATVLLPKGYDTHADARYPINYIQGHFSTAAPGGFGRNQPFTTSWLADGTPRFIYVTLQHPSPYYDDSYGVNSENNGPYGDAILQELMPAVESQFRVIREPWARQLSGGSTGGWIALAHQIFYPEMYGGTWASCPDSVDFRYHQIVNIYDDANAYWKDKGWMRVERPASRDVDGNIRSMMKDENTYELVVGDRSRSGGQWDIWEATYGPVGADGYPRRIWDKTTGVIDKTTAAYWKEHFDLRNIVETRWSALGSKLAGKLHVYVGENDTYYLDNGVHLLAESLGKLTNPPYGGEVVFQPRAPHCWGPTAAELLQKMTAHIERTAPAGADLRSWRY